MTRWAPAKKDVLDDIAGEIVHNYGRGRVVVAVDGTFGAGQREFADDLAAALNALGNATFRASMDGFQKPVAERVRYRADSTDRVYLDTFDYSAFRRSLIEPFRMAGSTGFVAAVYDESRDVRVEPRWLTARPDAILLVDGVFLHRSELLGIWNYTIWLDVDSDSVADTTAPDSDGRIRAEERYLAQVRPRVTTMTNVDNRDPAHPRRTFADSC